MKIPDGFTEWVWTEDNWFPTGSHFFDIVAYKVVES